MCISADNYIKGVMLPENSKNLNQNLKLSGQSLGNIECLQYKKSLICYYYLSYFLELTAALPMRALAKMNYYLK